MVKKAKMNDVNIRLMFEEHPRFGQKQGLDKVPMNNWEHKRELEYALQERLENREGSRIENKQAGA